MREVKSNAKKGLPTLARELEDRHTHDVSWSLTPYQLDLIMRRADSGDSRDQCRLCSEILDKDENIIQARETRRNAVMGCPWQIVPGGDSAAEKKAAAALEDELRACGGEDEQEGFEDFMEDLVTAVIQGFVVSEILWVDGGHIAGFHRIPGSAYHFMEGWYPRVVTKENPRGIEMPRERFVFHHIRRDDAEPSRGGLIRPLAWMHCFRSTNVKDLLSFIERHGMPFIVAKVDQSAFDSERAKITRLVRAFGPSGGGVVTRNVEMELLESHSTGDVYFRLLDYVKDAVDRLILGQTASSNESAGLSGGDAQSKVRQDILEADCRRVMRVVNLQVCKLWTQYNFGPGVRPPRLEIECEAPEDKLQLAQTVQALSAAGFDADEEEMSSRFGMTLKRRAVTPAVSLSQEPATSARIMSGENATAADLPATALQSWLSPVAGLLERLASDELSDDEYAQELRKLQDADRGELFGDSAAFEAALEGHIADHMTAGAAGAWKKIRRAKD